MPKFELGKLVSTAGVHALTEIDPDFYRFVIDSIVRHVCGDWGDLSPEDQACNEHALRNEGRLMSAYAYPGSPSLRIWIITEWDRRTTTILFPSEY